MDWIELSVYGITVSGMAYGLWHERKERRSNAKFLGEKLLEVVEIVAAQESKERKANSRFLAEQLIEVVKLVNAQSEVNKNQEEINMVMADNWELVGVHTGLLEATVNFGASVFLAEQEIARKEGEENA